MKMWQQCVGAFGGGLASGAIASALKFSSADRWSLIIGTALIWAAVTAPEEEP